MADGEVLDTQLPLCPREALGRLAGQSPSLDGASQRGDGTLWITLNSFQPRKSGERVQTFVELHHPAKRLTRLVVLSELEERIAQDAVSVAVGRVELDRLLRLDGRFPELVTSREDIGQMPSGSSVLRRELQ